jgi:AcrR family transcriptional regulator
VVKPAEVRRAELTAIASRLFAAKGYDATTIEDVIAAAGVSKGAFYHHFRAKEDLLEAVVADYLGQARRQVEAVANAPNRSPLQRLTGVMRALRDWKAAHMTELGGVAPPSVLTEPGSLLHRLTSAASEAFGPLLSKIIEDGARDGDFNVVDAGLAAELILGVSESRRPVLIQTIALARAGDLGAATELLVARVRAECATMERLLGVPPGALDAAGLTQDLDAMLSDYLAVE